MSTDENKQTYLGDGVYAYYDGHHVVLNTHDGISCMNSIYLDPDVVEALIQYLMRLRRGD